MTAIPSLPPAANVQFVDGSGVLMPWALRFMVPFTSAVATQVPAAQTTATTAHTVAVAAQTTATTAQSTATAAAAAAMAASAAVTAETTRAEAAELLLAPLASPTFTGTVTIGGTGGPTWTTGGAAPTSTQPVGSLYSRIGGAVGSTLYVSRGAGTWNAVAGV